ALVSEFFFGDEAYESTRAITALFDFAAISVVDAIAEIDVGVPRLFNDENLVGTDAEAAVSDMAPLFGGERDLLMNAVEHDKVVAGTVHFGEGKFHCPIIAPGHGCCGYQ